MSSTTSEQVVGEKGEKVRVSSGPPAMRTRAQSRAERSEHNLHVTAPRSAAVTANIVQGRGELAPAESLSSEEVPRRPRTSYGQVAIRLRKVVLSFPQLYEPPQSPLPLQMTSRHLPRLYCLSQGVRASIRRLWVASRNSVVGVDT